MLLGECHQFLIARSGPSLGCGKLDIFQLARAQLFGILLFNAGGRLHRANQLLIGLLQNTNIERRILCRSGAPWALRLCIQAHALADLGNLALRVRDLGQADLARIRFLEIGDAGFSHDRFQLREPFSQFVEHRPIRAIEESKYWLERVCHTFSDRLKHIEERPNFPPAEEGKAEKPTFSGSPERLQLGERGSKHEHCRLFVQQRHTSGRKHGRCVDGCNPARNSVAARNQRTGEQELLHDGERSLCHESHVDQRFGDSAQAIKEAFALDNLGDVFHRLLACGRKRLKAISSGKGELFFHRRRNARDGVVIHFRRLRETGKPLHQERIQALCARFGARDVFIAQPERGGQGGGGRRDAASHQVAQFLHHLLRWQSHRLHRVDTRHRELADLLQAHVRGHAGAEQRTIGVHKLSGGRSGANGVLVELPHHVGRYRHGAPEIERLAVHLRHGRENPGHTQLVRFHAGLEFAADAGQVEHGVAKRHNRLARNIEPERADVQPGEHLHRIRY